MAVGMCAMVDTADGVTVNIAGLRQRSSARLYQTKIFYHWVPVFFHQRRTV